MHDDVTRHPEADDDDAGGELTPAQRELAEALRGLRPAPPSGISRDRMLFEAGAASARGSLFRWRAAAAVLVIGNAALMTAALRSSPGDAMNATPVAQAPTTPTVPSEAPALPHGPTHARERPERPLVSWAAWDAPWRPARAVAPPFKPAPDAGYLSVRDAVLRDGLSALPEPPARAGDGNLGPLDVKELLGT